MILEYVLNKICVKKSVSENTKKSKQICNQIHNQSVYNEELIFDLLVTTSEFEFKIKDTFKSVSKLL